MLVACPRESLTKHSHRVNVSRPPGAAVSTVEEEKK